MPTKKITSIVTNPESYWVGDGFLINEFLSDFSNSNSPFLLLHWGVKKYFEPTLKKLGVGSHPHRGFETVTLVFEGELEHRDSHGNSGLIGKGEAQWMTAGSGILHEEYHSPNFAKTGGDLQMAQIWVNLPAKDKMTTPRYQLLNHEQIRIKEYENSKYTIYAGSLDIGDNQIKALTKTHSELQMYTVEYSEDGNYKVQFEPSWSAVILVISGSILVNTKQISMNSLINLEDSETEFEFQATAGGTKILVLSGQKLNDPIAHYGPFVMNNNQEINQAIVDFEDGRF
jgi:quercetin 2,3-dioxygenase